MGRKLQELWETPVERRPLDLYAALAEVAGRLRDADLEVIRPPDAEAVTVEVFARWLHGELAGPVRTGGGELRHAGEGRWQLKLAAGGTMVAAVQGQPIR